MIRTKFPKAKIIDLAAEAKRRRPGQRLVQHEPLAQDKALGLVFILREVDDLTRDERDLCRRLLAPPPADDPDVSTEDERALHELITRLVGSGKLCVIDRTLTDDDGGQPNTAEDMPTTTEAMFAS